MCVRACGLARMRVRACARVLLPVCEYGCACVCARVCTCAVLLHGNGAKPQTQQAERT